jgi:hypothetical protein
MLQVGATGIDRQIDRQTERQTDSLGILPRWLIYFYLNYILLNNKLFSVFS